MRTNIEIDDQLMAEAMEALGAKTKREAVEKALRRTITARRQLAALEELRGLGWEGNEQETRGNRYTVEA